jgi:hypothetical protein
MERDHASPEPRQKPAFFGVFAARAGFPRTTAGESQRKKADFQRFSRTLGAKRRISTGRNLSVF